MFIDKMSSAELLEEYRADLPEIQEQTLRFDRSEYVERYLWKRHKQQKVVLTKICTSTRGNRYVGILIYTQEGLGKQKKWNWASFHIGLMNTYKGVAAIAFYNESQQALTFTPHFFRRYKERFSKVCDWQTRNQLNFAKTTEEIVSIYVKRNLGTAWIETKSVFRNKVHIFAPVNDGVALLQWDKDKKLLQANTFVTLDMLDEKQSEMVYFARKYFSLTVEERKKFKFPDFISGDESS